MKDLIIKKGFLAILTALVIASCSKMDDIYKEFIKDGQIKYVGKADNAIIRPGRKRLVLTWPLPSDPKAETAKIYWNNRTDSIEIPVGRTAAVNDSIIVPFNNLSEGTYVFDIITFDNKGNSSMKVEVRGRVYGDEYEARLLSRPIDVAEMGGDTLKLQWGAPPESTVVGSELVYKDHAGKEQILFIPYDDLLTNILNFQPQTFKHRTVYLPSPLAIDTFYTAYSTLKIKGRPIDIDKTGWTITASSEDTKGGRLARNLIDGDLTNLFVNNLEQGLTYPHWATIDMGRMVSEIEGFYFYQRTLNPTKTIEILSSNDGESWNLIGEFVLPAKSEFAGEPVRVQLSSPLAFRYFKFIFKNDHGNSKNVNMHEAGVYTR